MQILGVGASVASGGLFGAISSAVGQWFQLKHKKNENEFKQKEWQHEINLIELQQKGQALETELELDIAHSQGSWSGLKASIESDAALSTNNYKWVNAVKSLFRPFITASLWCLAAFVFIKANGGEDLSQIHEYMVYTIFFTASSATMWWFGDRGYTPKALKNL